MDAMRSVVQKYDAASESSIKGSPSTTHNIQCTYCNAPGFSTMQFTLTPKLLALSTLLLFAIPSFSTPVPDEPYHMSVEQLKHWLANTDAEITYVGEPLNPLSSRDAFTTTVTYCNFRSGDVCGGSCTMYTGGPKCLDAPSTQCLSATGGDVSFCDRRGCNGSCHQYLSCGTKLANGFCWTPGTSSIAVAA